MQTVHRVLAIGLALALTVWAAHADVKEGTANPVPPGYTPGLGEFMGAVQLRHAKLWFAGRAKNWPLATYELDELKEGLADAAKYQPEFEGHPVAQLIGSSTTAPIERLDKAIAAKNARQFAQAFDALSQACSGCHRAADHGFIVIQRPTSPPLTNQRFQLGRAP